MPSGDIEAIFSLQDSDFTFSMWQHHFKISYRIILREKELHLNIGVYNPSKEASFDFNVMLHAYFKCPDVRRCQVTGLNGVTFLDRTRQGPEGPGAGRAGAPEQVRGAVSRGLGVAGWLVS